jgi:hypothetical protein
MQLGRKKGVLPLGEPTGTYLQQTHACLELIGIRRLSVLERGICAATATMTTETFNKNKQQNPVHRRMIETLSDMLSPRDLRFLPTECAIWLALIIAGPLRPSISAETSPASSPSDSGRSVEPQRPRETLLDQIIQDKPVARNWKWVKKTVQKFFYSEELLEAWRQTWEASLLRYVDIIKQEREQEQETP